jgi:hypothetical protein
LGSGGAMPRSRVGKSRELVATHDRVRHRDDRRNERTRRVATARAFGYRDRERGIGKLGRLARGADECLSALR